MFALSCCKMLKILLFSEISDRVKGVGKNFHLYYRRLGKLFDEKSVEDGCFVWMTPANSHLHSLSKPLMPSSFLKINRMVNGPESTHEGCRQPFSWSMSPSSQDKHCCCLSFTAVSVLLCSLHDISPPNWRWKLTTLSQMLQHFSLSNRWVLLGGEGLPV